VTEPYLRRRIKELGLRTIADITNVLKAGGACRSCHYAPGGLQDLLNECWGRALAQTASPSIREGEPLSAASVSPRAIETKGLIGSPYQRMKQIEKVVETRVRPALRADGGDVEVVDIKDDLVYCRLQGACAACPGAATTLKLMVERLLKEEVDEHIRVIAV